MANGTSQIKSSVKGSDSSRLRRHESYIEVGKQTFANNIKKAKDLAANKRVQATAATAAGGAAVFGASGAAVGSVVGGAIGGAIGFIPAIFTFGLSIPIGAAIGGGCGMVAGATVVGGAGLVGGGTLGYFGYANEKCMELRGVVLAYCGYGYTSILDVVELVRAHALAVGASAERNMFAVYGAVKTNVTSFTAKTQKQVALVSRDVKFSVQETAKATKDKTIQTVSDRNFQVTAASATGGAVALGSGGAACGFVGGGAVGAAVGVVPAIFTLGLSIPIGAAIGSTCGVVAGAVVGGTTGLVGGGAAGYGYTKRAEIKIGVADAASKVSSGAVYVKDTAVTSAGNVRSRVLG